jgi:hypothetical protein
MEKLRSVKAQCWGGVLLVLAVGAGTAIYCVSKNGGNGSQGGSANGSQKVAANNSGSAEEQEHTPPITPRVQLSGSSKEDAKRSGVPSQMTVEWNPSIIFAPDASHPGPSTPCLMGRLYLSDGDLSVLTDGTLEVTMFEEHPSMNGDGMPIPLERWTLTKETLNDSAKRDDGMGWGYSLCLPWVSYRLDIPMVKLSAKFTPVQGKELTFQYDLKFPASTVTTSVR